MKTILDNVSRSSLSKLAQLEKMGQDLGGFFKNDNQLINSFPPSKSCSEDLGAFTPSITF